VNNKCLSLVISAVDFSLLLFTTIV
jgi:hypothetical protein